MTHTYALKRLLEHGPLTFAEIVDISGWAFSSVDSALRRLINADVVEQKALDARRFHYALVEKS